MKRLIALLVCLLLGLSAAHAQQEGVWVFAVVHNPDPADRLNLRVKPEKDSISLGKFYNGTPVTITDIQGEWAQVTLYDGLGGYMHTDYLAMGEAADAVLSAMPLLTVIAPSGKTVRSSMLADAQASVPLEMGRQLEVMGVMEDWLFVRSGDIVGFTTNDGTMPRVTFSSRDATPAPLRMSIAPTPTPSPTPLPAAADGQVYAYVAVSTTLYADEALTVPLSALERETVLAIEDFSSFVCRASFGGQMGYVSSSVLAFGSEFGPAITNVAVEDARAVTADDWVIFAAISAPTTMYADKAMMIPAQTLQKGEFIRIFNDMDAYATVVRDGRIAGYIPASGNFTVHTSEWPFHVSEASAVVNNPVVSDRLHLRAEPYKDAVSLGRYYNGVTVTLLDNFTGRNEWTKVSVCGAQGYMMTKYLDFSTNDTDNIHPCMSLYEIANPNTGDLHLRSEPGTDAKSLGLYPNGTLVAVLGVAGDWVHVACDGQAGYMLHRYLKTSVGTGFDPQ